LELKLAMLVCAMPWAAGMAPGAGTACEDETLHPATCLVALEPVSGFILLEQYAADRTAATWMEALSTACVGLPIEARDARMVELRAHVAGEADRAEADMGRAPD
jgi:hypothetical protein